MQGNNILLVANWESGVGYAWWLMENFWVEIAEHFSARGHASYLAYPKITSLPDSIANSTITTVEIDMQDHSMSNLLRIRSYIRKHGIRYIYLSDAATSGLFYIWLKLAGVRSIVAHDHSPGDRTRPSTLRRMIKSLRNRLPLYNIDHMIAVTGFVEDRLKNINCIPANRISVAANGIIPLSREAIDSDYCNREFGIPHDRTIIITTGRANIYKGIDFFIACADELINRQHISTLHFLFCGDGPDIDSFRKMVSESGLEDHFTFAGKRDDIRKILPACDIGMHCALGEVGYSLSILEYMSAGLGTLVPDRASTRQATIDGVTGLIYRPADVTSASDAIKRLLDPQLAHDMGVNASRSVEQDFNLQQTNASLLHILDRVFS